MTTGMRDWGWVMGRTGDRLRSGYLLGNGPPQAAELRLPAEAEDPLHHASPAVEQDRVGQAAIMVDALHPAAPDEDRERRRELRHEGAHRPAVHVVRDGDDVEVPAVERSVELRHVGE